MTHAAASAAPTLSRALLALLTVLLVALMTSITAVGVITGLIIAVSLLRLTDGTLRARDRAPLAWPLLAFAATTLLSALVAGHPGPALWESKHLLGIALFLAAVNGFRDGDDVRRALRWLYLAVAVVSVHAFVQVWACGIAVPLPDVVSWALRLKLEACRASPLFRAKGFFSIYMTLGGSLLISLALIVASLAVGARWRLALHAVTGTLAVAALALTYVRSAWLGLGAAVLVVSGFTRRHLLLLGLVLAATIALSIPSPLRQRALSIVDPADPTARERIYFWEAGARMLRDAPLLGMGPGGVKRHYPEYRDPAARRPTTGHLHNNAVQIAAERGVLGLAAWLAIWIAFFVQAGRIYARLPATRVDDRALVAGSLAAVAGFFVAGLFEYNFGDSEVINLLWVVMAFPFVVDPRHAAASY
ncbi:MAG: O-antigen ligase family protein [Gammaproteobacteria bacterium]